MATSNTIEDGYIEDWRWMLIGWLGWTEERFERFVRAFNLKLTRQRGGSAFYSETPIYHIIPLLVRNQFDERLRENMRKPEYGAPEWVYFHREMLGAIEGDEYYTDHFDWEAARERAVKHLATYNEILPLPDEVTKQEKRILAFLDIEEAEKLLRPMVLDKITVIYQPDMPDQDGKVCRWFQVIFAVGPCGNALLRAEVHDLFLRMLVALSSLTSVCEADHVCLSARHFLSDQKSSSDRPLMLIQADWPGPAIQQMRKDGDFSVWPNVCLTYRNELDRNDEFNKQAKA
jgi:hypothetical protein